ncbi:diacylglycerol kinase family lipid kinase [soil metagenome]
MINFVSNQATLIFNPHAGFWEWRQLVDEVAHFWQQRGWQVSIQPTQYGGHATELARAAVAANHGLVFAVGGDGTLNEVANGLVHSETVLAFLPVGTANSFARELGGPRPNLLNPKWLLDTSMMLTSGYIQRVDMGRCDNGRYWLLWASTGVDAFMVDQIEPRSKLFKRMGPAGYLAKALLALPTFSGIQSTVTVDDQSVTDDFLLINVSNCRMFAGGELHLNTYGLLDDGLFEVWLFRGSDWPDVLRYTVEIGLQQHASNPNVIKIRGRRVTIATARPQPFHLDGEPSGTTPFTCEIMPGVLRLLTPSTAPPDLFCKPGQVIRL